MGQAVLRWTGEKNPFSSAKWVSRIPSFPCDNLHLLAKKKMPRKSGFAVSLVVLLATEWDHVLVAEKAPSLSLLIRLCYGSELGKHFMIWFNSCLWNCFCQAAHDYQHHEENSLLSTWIPYRAISVTLEFSGSEAFPDIISLLVTRYELEEIPNPYFLMPVLSFKTTPTFEYSIRSSGYRLINCKGQFLNGSKRS